MKGKIIKDMCLGCNKYKVIVAMDRDGSYCKECNNKNLDCEDWGVM